MLGKHECILLKIGLSWLELDEFVQQKSMADIAENVSGHTCMTLGHTHMRWLVGVAGTQHTRAITRAGE